MVYGVECLSWAIKKETRRTPRERKSYFFRQVAVLFGGGLSYLTRVKNQSVILLIRITTKISSLLTFENFSQVNLSRLV